MIDLNSLKHLYNEIDKDDLKENDIDSFKDFKEYIIEQLISNIEYDFDLDFYDYVDMNDFIKEVEQ